MSTPSFEIPVAHIHDPDSITCLENAYRDVHNDEVAVTVGFWEGGTQLEAPSGKTAYRFVVEATDAHISLTPGDPVRGGQVGPYESTASGHRVVTASHHEAVWPGDAIVTNDDLGPLELLGSGVYFEVIADSTDYPAPKLSLLRNLGDHPGGCAAYEEAFRRETLPPAPPDPASADRIGSNRVNEHTLDMRYDRQPPPSKHHHGPAVGPDGRVSNHTETAVVLARSVYGLPQVGSTDEGHAVIFRDPLEKGTEDAFKIPLQPGSIVVTPSTPERLYGHSFENAFAMLVAIPGFVVPYELIR